jgi:hypothetical protein
MKVKMKKREKQILLEEAIKTIEDFNVVIDEALAVAIDMESKLGKEIFNLHVKYLESISLLVGDEGEWLQWYVYENDYGRNKMKVTCGTTERHIENIEDLLWVLNYE